VDDALTMGVRERASDVAEDALGLGVWERPRGESLAQ
jgi:hypothetical protein